jgi:RNA polymerase primary sigma factor
LDDDPVKVYLREVTVFPPMTPNEELDLSLHVRAGDQQAESSGSRLVEANLQLVVSIAERHRDSGVHILDLIQKGNEGLLLALETFADSSSDSFSAHAAICIDCAIAKHIADSKLKSES